MKNRFTPLNGAITLSAQIETIVILLIIGGWPRAAGGAA